MKSSSRRMKSSPSTFPSPGHPLSCHKERFRECPKNEKLFRYAYREINRNILPCANNKGLITKNGKKDGHDSAYHQDSA